MRINYRVPPDLVNLIEQEIGNKGFSDRSELVTVALREHFNKEQIEGSVQIYIKKFLESDEGKELILMTIKNER